MSDVSNPTPAGLPASVLKKDPMKLRGRAYGLGERNPETLPGSGKNAETVWENQARSRKLSATRKWVQSANSAGYKY